MGSMIRRSNAGTRRMVCRLTEGEKSEKRLDLVASCGVILDIEKRLAAAAATVKLIKDELGAEQKRHDLIAKCLVSGEEERSVEYDEVFDYENSRIIEIRVDTQEVAGVRDMNDNELNQTLSFVGDEVQDPDELTSAVVLYFDRAGRAERVEVGRAGEPEDKEGGPDEDEEIEDVELEEPGDEGGEEGPA